MPGESCAVRLITCRKKHEHSDSCAWTPCVRRGPHDVHVTELATEENGLLPQRRATIPPCGWARCEVLASGEAAHVGTCPNFGVR